MTTQQATTLVRHLVQASIKHYKSVNEGKPADPDKCAEKQAKAARRILDALCGNGQVEWSEDEINHAIGL